MAFMYMYACTHVLGVCGYRGDRCLCLTSCTSRIRSGEFNAAAFFSTKSTASCTREDHGGGSRLRITQAALHTDLHSRHGVIQVNEEGLVQCLSVSRVEFSVVWLWESAKSIAAQGKRKRSSKNYISSLCSQ